MFSRVVSVSLAAVVAVAWLPQCGSYMQLRKVTGYYECVRPEGVKESMLISGYGYVAWSGLGEEEQYAFELKGKENMRMASTDSQGEPTLWQDFSYTRQGDELYFAPKLPKSSCERWVQRQAPSRDSRPTGPEFVSR